MRALAALVLFVTLFVPDVFRLKPEATGVFGEVFTFHNTFWPNLHHFLYVLGRAQRGSPDANRRAVVNAPRDAADPNLSDAERRTWDAAVAYYEQRLSTKDAIFDKELIAISRELAAAGNAPTLEGRVIDAELRQVLEAAAPAYSRGWWARHRAANDARIAELNPLIAEYGDAVRDRITRAYGQPWREQGVTIEMCAYANWAGAYSTDGGLLVLSSLDPGNAATQGLEILFHEAMHQWDDQAFRTVREETRRQGRRVPDGLTHAMIFYTAGDAARREIGGHVPYAELNGIWVSGPFARYKEALDRLWLPWLDGRATGDEAFAALLNAAHNLDRLLNPADAEWKREAPARFTARLDTSRGDIFIDVARSLAPRGADRFYNLVRLGYYDDARFFRVVSGRWAQFGINGNPRVAAIWRTQTLPDDPRQASNVRGAVAFAWAVPNGRTTQVFISLRDNSATLDEQGFAPIGHVTRGMDVADALYAGYGEESGGGIRGGRQDPLFEGGNDYLLRHYPRLDYIRRATIEVP